MAQKSRRKKGTSLRVGALKPAGGPLTLVTTLYPCELVQLLGGGEVASTDCTAIQVNQGLTEAGMPAPTVFVSVACYAGHPPSDSPATLYGPVALTLKTEAVALDIVLAASDDVQDAVRNRRFDRLLDLRPFCNVATRVERLRQFAAEYYASAPAHKYVEGRLARSLRYSDVQSFDESQLDRLGSWRRTWSAHDECPKCRMEMNRRLMTGATNG